MSRGWFFVALVVFVLGGCSGGPGGGSAVTVPVATPSPPPLDILGYAVVTSTATESRVLKEYPLGSTIATRTFTELGGAGIRLDTAGTLWSDHIGDFVGYRSDGSSAGNIFGLSGSLRAFDVRGKMYVATCCSLDVYPPGASTVAALERSITTTAFACSAAADGTGNVYLAQCTTGPSGNIWQSLRMYGPTASGNTPPSVTNAAATGPVAVDHAGNVYAVYAGGIGVWSAGAFSAGAPGRVLALTGGLVGDIAADRAGNVYVVVQPAPFVSGSSTLYFFAAGSNTPAPLQLGPFGVTTVP